MATKSPIALILGAGPNIGQSVVRKFASKGYKVALASRSLEESDSTNDQLHIPSDFSKPDGIIRAFERVKDVFGIPSVVVYNASRSSRSPPDDPFALSFADFSDDQSVIVNGLFIAAQQAVFGFAQLSSSASRTFLYTGNILNVSMIPGFMALGAGKSASAYIIWTASAAYKDRGYKFYYVDERKADGANKSLVDGDAHADLFWDLAQSEEQGPWLQTFIKGEGYKSFETSYKQL
ncbi:short chain type dehydrogenase [Fusarium heterosporum]|uniref:Short chain type dehydrogenase n=1 Tax=Fusarium heterosporum TaxID=42747 RepID=A0A8H5WQZ3_FUSHE|nr:short chain type dehydrogenase [Fusarium heterosporum]